MNNVVAVTLDCEALARERKVFHAEFGAFVQKLRTDAGFRSQPEAELRANQLKLKTVSQQRISLLEKGKTKDPDPALLRELAVLYKTEYDTIIKALIGAKYGAERAGDLTRHTGGVQRSTHPSGGADVPAEARIRELEDRLAAYQTIIRRIRKPIAEFIALVGDSDEGAKPIRKRSGRRRRD